MKKFLLPPDKSLWTGRTDRGQHGNYLHEIVVCRESGNLEMSVPKGRHSVAILGYGVDEGVARNGGRAGAAHGPVSIRKFLAKSAVHFPTGTEIIDWGDIIAPEKDLEGAHEAFTNTLSKIRSAGHFTICFGGGHDMAYPHYKGIENSIRSGQKIGIINLDAHFDLRIPETLRNSGTPFYQIAMDCKAQGREFNYLCLGVQQSSNSRLLFKTAEELGVSYVLAEEFKNPERGGVDDLLNSFLAKTDLIYLTIDMDGFSSSFSPGVSAPTPNGFSIDDALFVIEKVVASGKITGLDFAETNPEYDIDDRTGRLVAYLTNKFLELWLKE